jgi:hypothetical protein
MDNEKIQVINLAEYKAPIINESTREDWVEYGEDNNYFQFLIDRHINSATNNAVINNITRLIYGKGLTALDANKKPNEFAQLITLISSDDLRKISVEAYLLGQCAIQVHYDKKRTKILKAYHIPVQLLRAEKCNEDGEITGYYYSDNWEDVKKYKPKRLDAFGFGSSEIEILYVKPYSVGMKYYSNVTYTGGLPYTIMEEEIAEYLINDVQNGFSPTMIVNFVGGTGTEEQRRQIESQANKKLTGSKGKKIVYSFNKNKDNATTIESIPLNDAPNHYQFLSEECMRKIMLAHNVTSPLIFGIATSTGFSSNADELKNSLIIFENLVIKPYQELITDAIAKILAVNGVSLNLEFVPLQPLDASGELTNNDSKRIIDGINSLSPLVANKVLESMTANEVRALVGLAPETGGSDLNTTTLSSQELDLSEFGEELNEDEWVLIDSHKVDYDNEDELDAKIKELNNQQPTKLKQIINLVKTGVANPNASSSQDGEIFKSRYRYSGNVGENSRAFCKAMLSSNKVYRKEDIIRMESQEVNKGWGAEGADNYSIWLYKGGGDCHHYWTRETYLRKSDVNSPLAKKFTPSEARKQGEILPTNDNRVYQQPKDMPYNGFLPTNKRFN